MAVDTKNMTLPKLADYYDDKLPDSALVMVPNGMLKESKARDAVEEARKPAEFEALAYNAIRKEAEQYWLAYLKEKSETPVEYPKGNLDYWMIRIAFSHHKSVAPPKPAPDAVRDALEQYKNDWRRAAVEAFGPNIHTDQLSLFIKLANLNGLFDPAKAAISAPVPLANYSLTNPSDMGPFNDEQ